MGSALAESVTGYNRGVARGGLWRVLSEEAVRKKEQLRDSRITVP